MDMSPWDFAVIISKLMIYIGVSGAIGGIFMCCFAAEDKCYRQSVGKYCFASIFVGFLGVISNFFSQVGAFSDNGVTGMYDEFYLSMLWQSNAGEALVYRCVGFLLASYLVGKILWSTARSKLDLGLYLLSIGCLAISFSLIGHSAELTLFNQFFISIHVLLIAWWLGSLWPLWRGCSLLPLSVIKQTMEKFGVYASYSVLLLIACGALVGYQLVGSVTALFFSVYGQIFLIKLSAVALLIGLAAVHKLQLVPALRKNSNGAMQLQRSIKYEMYIATAVLTATTWLTTMVGPSHS
ncbi:copper resistance D family protein [Thalassotalea sp. ND16A]|uniref:copper resistance D family protein n=1 Tax=Thalassotalea sp. ND16A TaxID=1535422 RepID=UPI00051A8364|nr:CopD family protein [Thalassotalea sp. ND16A]KGK00141.1 hypothetical protein ND16A_0332 [Thalassotalea sp. ND16A]